MKFRLLAFAVVGATLAACASQPSPGYGRASAPSAPPMAVRCLDCGRVEAIETVYGARQNTRTGAVLGGIVGGVVGNQVGKGDGKKAATVAGVVGGAIAGNAIENKRNEQTYNITVRMEDGRLVVINQNTISPELRQGSPVRVTGNRVVLLR
ncbi:MAG TPA: glycine zipper 2TM domain-containing protein [Arenimonas sp.]|uniref:glycine zipper 2TM domain-containing protein n=1 Tax=Arenimonas sp. TaxID=1872635 RepID=UPI002CB2D0B2|nr:glycine zipper 2TM domain-containing protein [Arenimonas sp.]HMB56410.1 glycine zipper 2TM domain-containing protein [Arenimonas sp.]